MVSFFSCECSDQAESGMRFLDLFLTVADPLAANNFCDVRLYCSFIRGIQVFFARQEREMSSPELSEAWAPPFQSLRELSEAGRRGRDGTAGQSPLAFPPFWPQIGVGRLAVDEPLANRVRSGRKQP